MQERLAEAAQLGEQIQESWEGINRFLLKAEAPNGERFNLEAPIPGTNFLLQEVNERVVAMCGLLQSLKDVESTSPIPDSHITGLKSHLDRLIPDVLTLKARSDEGNKKGAVSTLTPSNWVVRIAATGAEHNFASLLQNVVNKMDSVLIQFYQIAGIVSSPGYSAFAHAAEAMAGILSDAETKRAEIEEITSEASFRLNDATNHAEQANSACEVVAKALKNVNELQAAVVQRDQESTTVIASVREVSDQSAALKQAVERYGIEFEEFQAALDERNAKYQTNKELTDNLGLSLEEKNKEAGQLIEKANMMLKGATNAGLATTFSETLEEINGKLQWAKLAFYVSITLLIGSALPLAGYLYKSIDLSDPPSVITQTSEAAKTGPEVAAKGEVIEGAIDAVADGVDLGKTLALVLLMVPAIWLTRFSAAQHHHLFQLKEHYRYKYSLAMGVDGFKEQAPEYENEIAAATFFELTFNPADKLEEPKGATKHPNPILDKVMDKMGMNHKGRESK
ncbi:hypothetical protein [Magnetospira sp. QH-2]|uniref:hypothetical protein n=1 Tax=Magnetospira sp. (strain QH-2) TaxID=1288970 RepID=UPI0003E80C86|nr:hypothetical protein [Magnetospira sp. QH-2]CCQ73914.1 Protein of unknown function [Magnetospira sp. QH-2]